MTSVRDVAFNPAGTHIASAALDGEVKLWSSSNGSQVCVDISSGAFAHETHCVKFQRSDCV